MLPSADVLLERARVVSLPLTTRFRGIVTRELLLLEGPDGWAEFSPFVEYGDAETANWLAAAIEFGWGGIATPGGNGRADAAHGSPAPAAAASVPVNATVPAIPAADVPELLARFPGCRTAKVKVAERGQSLADDLARVRAVRIALGPEGRIRVDANGGWTVDVATAALTELAEVGLEYAEQPCATVPELAAVRERLGGLVRIAADESVRKAEDPLAVARAGAADLLVIKAQPLGGVRRAAAIVAEAGLPAVVSSALESSVGVAQGAHLAAALGLAHETAAACGLGTAALLAADVTAHPLVPVAGAIPVARVTPDPALLAAHAASPERDAWWRERLRRARALL
ncbi:o-succinylbenzoate synthase [Arenivirga flava]|uniref:o-succinylbenzoate synthase n=1 Tax=Arenivirga flava TaxID=1930060 RepID=A0AA37UHR9_9MICO|nr:o-succinylbenzoate synthase [Arenivirga flava]GMA29209.1 o-succinylbenzoate synthase [Arenivirga flava]